MRACVCVGTSPPLPAFDTRLRRWYAPADGSVKFDVGVVLQGDVLMRCRHKRRGGKKSVAMFRAAFHTGYTPELVLRFSLAQLEGTSAARYPDDFFVELIFAPVDASGDAVSGTRPRHVCGCVWLCMAVDVCGCGVSSRPDSVVSMQLQPLWRVVLW